MNRKTGPRSEAGKTSELLLLDTEVYGRVTAAMDYTAPRFFASLLRYLRAALPANARGSRFAYGRIAVTAAHDKAAAGGRRAMQIISRVVWWT